MTEEVDIPNRTGEFVKIVSRNKKGISTLKRDWDFNRSFVIDVNELSKDQFDDLVERPDETIDYAKQALYALKQFPKWEGDMREVEVRFSQFPYRTPIRGLKNKRNKFVSAEGIVRRIVTTKPMITVAAFKCNRCGKRVYENQERYLREPEQCDCGSKSWELQPERSTTRNMQTVLLQESPEGLSGGEMPADINVELYNDLCDVVLPGKRLIVSGVVKAYPNKKGSLILNPTVEGNFIELKEVEFCNIEITEEDERNIKLMGTDPNIFDRIVSYIAPSVLGQDGVKGAIALQLFGGISSPSADGTRTRGDIHILLCGDPGLAKSHILKSVSSIAPRSVFTSGKGSSSAGLTATAVRDGDNWVLDAGAAVLADRALLIVDEMDKMEDNDRSSLHTAMEQQEIYIAKAGISTTLQTRCSILAAANPKLGRFDMYSDLSTQLDLPPTLLSRFDLIFLLLDVPDATKDREIADFVLQLRGRKKLKVDITLIRKYIAYARQNIEPEMSKDAHTALVEHYSRMRGLWDRDKPMPITVRQLEALIRMSQASAKMRLSPTVDLSDAQRVIALMNDCLKGVAFDERSGIFDVDKMGGKSKMTRDITTEVRQMLFTLQAAEGTTIDMSRLVKEMEVRGYQRANIEKVIEGLKREGHIMEPKNGYLKLIP